LRRRKGRKDARELRRSKGRKKSKERGANGLQTLSNPSLEEVLSLVHPVERKLKEKERERGG